MPSNIFLLATELEKELAPISKKNIKPISKLLQSTNPASDQELIETVQLMKSTIENKYAEKSLPDKKQKFIKSCENFLLQAQAAEEMQNYENPNAQYNRAHSPLYKLPEEKLVQILKYLNQEELQTTATVSKFLKYFIYGKRNDTDKNLIETAPAVSRDYTQLPRKKNWQLSKEFAQPQAYLCIAEQLIITSGDTINVHNIYTGKILHSLKTKNKINHLALSLDNKHMIGSNIEDIYVWETKNWKKIKTAKLPDKVMKMIPVPGNTILTACGREYDIKFWDMDDWKCLETKNFSKPNWSGIFNGEFVDISHVAAAKIINLTVVAYEKNLYILCGEQWKTHFRYCLEHPITCLAFIKDNEFAAEFVAGTNKGEIFKWQYDPVTKTFRQPTFLGQCKSEITSITTNGEILIVGTKNGSIQLLSGKDWTNLKEKSDHPVQFTHFISTETFIVLSGKEVSLYHFLPKVAEKIQAEDAIEKENKMEADTVSSNPFMP